MECNLHIVAGMAKWQTHETQNLAVVILCRFESDSRHHSFKENLTLRSMMQDCIFCKIIAKQIKAEFILETKHCIVIKDIYPKAAIHLLIIPKKHIESVKFVEIDDANILSDLLLTAKELSTTVPHASDFKLVINNGAKAGQHVFHLHMHFLAGIAHDRSLV